MVDDAFEGFGALTCGGCGTSLDLRWSRSRVTFTCAECGTAGTVARATPRRAWLRRSPRLLPAPVPSRET